jgi:hypothetical protein
MPAPQPDEKKPAPFVQPARKRSGTVHIVGLSPDVADPMMARGELPNLRGLGCID